MQRNDLQCAAMMTYKRGLRTALAFFFGAFSYCVIAAPAWSEQQVDFNRDIRPLLSSNCFACHGPDEEQRTSDLRLDTQSGSRVDLGGFAAVVPGDPAASELITRITTADEDLRMPPTGKGRSFTDSEIELLKRWIQQGATYARHWSYEKPTRPELPTVAELAWPKNAIDYFILSRLEAESLMPAEEASRLVLARRVAIDLTGLPPTWEEAQAFVHDNAEDAYSRYVDQQLAKPAFGERWARVWLDLARYADSAGYADDPPRVIWAYRDYVIKALNKNLPFDQFTIEQIAGDLLENPSEEQLIATAFHRNTMTNNEGGTNDEEFRNVAIVDRVNTTMAVWMGTTMGCAQCHSHKYDPISQEEYFQFFAFFNNTADADTREELPIHEIWTEQQGKHKSQLQTRIADLKQILNTTTADLELEQQQWLAGLQSEPTWQPLLPASASGEQRELSIGEAGWIEAQGEKAASDLYELEFSTTPSQLAGLRLEVAADQTSNFVLYQVKAHWKPKEPQPIDAQFVRIELPGEKKIIHLAEVQIFSGGKNVALTGKASQSSTGFGGKVEYAIDGNTNGEFNNKSVTHTAIEDSPWLEIDLGALQRIDNVAIWNRTDNQEQIGNRLAGFRLVLLDEQRNVVWQTSPDVVPMPSATYLPDGSLELGFEAAFADFSQEGFDASSVLQAKIDREKGWAIGGAMGQGHELTLVLPKAMTFGEGTLAVTLVHGSKYEQHLLDRFRLLQTADQSLVDWARIPKDIAPLIRMPNKERNDEQHIELAKYYRSIAPSLISQRTELNKLEEQYAKLKPQTTVPIMRDLEVEKRRITKVQLRGNYQSTAQEVSEATPAAFHPLEEDRKRDRLALANWLIDQDNPLTARVIANRHWEQLFGIGIVETSEEFGSQGELPSHPQLLDWLAVELVESGWDLKHLLKLMVTSAAYRQSSSTTDELLEIDPFNRLLSRGPRFRLSAEMIRDQALFVSGLLSDKMYGAASEATSA